MYQRKVKNKPNQASDLDQALVRLEDESAEFYCLQSFLCSAFTAVMSSNHAMRVEVIQGARQCSEMLEERAWKLRQSISDFGRFVSHGRGTFRKKLLFWNLW